MYVTRLTIVFFKIRKELEGRGNPITIILIFSLLWLEKTNPRFSP
jgi:hypothetical protein